MRTTLMIRRCFCTFTTPSLSPTTATSFPPNANKKKPLVFLGSPEVSTKVLDALFTSSETPTSNFQVVAIVTQPPSARNRGRKVLPSPVAQYALDRGFPPELIFTPELVGEETFLSDLKSLQPDICITAAYGNILPTKFLNIPAQGTVNIHPSLLPLYRGAAPVQRALQDGVKETGVSLAFTVRALDAGPVIAHERFAVDNKIKAPELLDFLFSVGSKLLVRELPSILDGSARANAQPQDDSKATLAPKLTPEESWLSFEQEAYLLHNKVRAFAGWPGTRAKVQIVDPKNGESNPLDLKIITTRVAGDCKTETCEPGAVIFNKGVLLFPCAEKTALEVLEVQLPGKKVASSASFWNGLRGVFSVNIDEEEEKVTVRGKVESSKLIRKLAKSGKHAKLWSPTSNTDPSGDIKNHQLMEEEEEQNNETGEFEGLLEYEAPEMRRTPIGYDHYHQRYTGFYDGSVGYMYHHQQQHYPPSSSSIMPGPNIYSMMVDGKHRQIRPTWPRQDAYPLRVSHIWDY
ncbi:hypothetical protein V2J09_013312 [Rumex salicifolius]